MRRNKRTMVAAAVWGLAMPLAMYELSIAEMVRATPIFDQEREGKKKEEERRQKHKVVPSIFSMWVCFLVVEQIMVFLSPFVSFFFFGSV